MVYDSGVTGDLHRAAEPDGTRRQWDFENAVPAGQHDQIMPCEVYRSADAGGSADDPVHWGVLYLRGNRSEHTEL